MRAARSAFHARAAKPSGDREGADIGDIRNQARHHDRHGDDGDGQQQHHHRRRERKVTLGDLDQLDEERRARRRRHDDQADLVWGVQGEHPRDEDRPQRHQDEVGEEDENDPLDIAERAEHLPERVAESDREHAAHREDHRYGTQQVRQEVDHDRW